MSSTTKTPLKKAANSTEKNLNMSLSELCSMAKSPTSKKFSKTRAQKLPLMHRILTKILQFVRLFYLALSKPLWLFSKPNTKARRSAGKLD